jgi:hypothetical protein
MGRPRKDIDPRAVLRLAELHCTVSEIASVLGCSPDTLARRYAAEIAKGKDTGRMSLRRMQWAAARKGNVTMLIFLGKAILGQSDRPEEMTPQEARVRLAAALGCRPEELPGGDEQRATEWRDELTRRLDRFAERQRSTAVPGNGGRSGADATRGPAIRQ